MYLIPIICITNLYKLQLYNCIIWLTTYDPTRKQYLLNNMNNIYTYFLFQGFVVNIAVQLILMVLVPAVIVVVNNLLPIY